MSDMCSRADCQALQLSTLTDVMHLNSCPILFPLELQHARAYTAGGDETQTLRS